ncbi:MAG: methionyl-tRNA formyltransferase [Chloroflexota bacterium]|mgnify:CR=1 FL=1|nr:MAG: methionyl-tRNA formyltransferase [Chloroflexota bacterium]
MRVLFLGTPRFAAIPLERLARDGRFTLVGIVTQPDRPVGRTAAPQPPPVKERAAELGLQVPVLQPETLRDPQVVAELAALRPDVAVVAAYGEILRRDVLAIPPLGYLNIHPSLLPLYRGPAPVAAAILNGDTETGVTVMRLEAKMDAGPVLAQRRVPLPPDARAGALTDELFALGAELLVEVLPAYADGSLVPQPQDHERATYTGLLKKEDGRIDWSAPAAHIERMTRAYDPWPGAYTSWRGQMLKIIAARCIAAGDAPPEAAPGTLLDGPAGPLVVTGDGLLELVTVQPAGRRPMDARAWRQGLRDIAGARLGEPAADG